MSTKNDKSVLQSGIIGNKRLNARQLSSIIESLSCGVIAFDPLLRIIESNAQAQKLLAPAESIDKSMAAGTDANIWGNWTRQFESVIETSNPANFEMVRYTLNGQKCLLQITCTPLKDSDTGKAIGGAAVIEDITERVEAQNQLARDERLAAMGKVAGRVAHELNNPMDGILRYLSMATKVVEKEGLGKPKEYLRHCKDGLMRMVTIVAELLEFSRNTYSDFDYADIDKIVADAARAMDWHSKGVEIRVINNCPENLPQVRAGSLFQVFCNLIKNATDAMGQKGQLDIEISTHDKMLEVSFADTGPGFDEGHTEQLFKPFFTTKTRGKGTGLGLAICKDLIEKCDGTIVAKNRTEGGSIFMVSLPMSLQNTNNKEGL